MKASKYLYLAALTLPMVLASCRGQTSKKPAVHPNMNMDQQQRFEPQEQNEFFADNRAMRQPVEGTIARGHLRQDKAYFQGINEDSSFVTDIPVEVTKSFLYRGKDRYEVFCTPCHGLSGDGQGIIMTGGYGYVPAPSFHQPRLRNVNDGYIFSAITVGIRNMPSYAHQIPVEDRWAIVAYVRALQRSQHVPEEEMKKYDVNLASLRESHDKKQAEEAARKEAQAQAKGDEEVSAERGRRIADNNACLTCHSTDGSKMMGPTWQNLFGHEVVLAEGETVKADEAYLTESIVNSTAKIVKGFSGVMPNYDYLSESEVQSLVAYIKSLSEAGASENEGESGGEGSTESSGQETESSGQDPQSSGQETQTLPQQRPDEPDQPEQRSQMEGQADAGDTDTLSSNAQMGKALVDKFKCLSCHTLEDREKDLAPPFRGLYGKTVSLSDGSTVLADEGYLKESMQYPGAAIVEGYNENMPSYRDLLTDPQMQSIVDYLKSLKN